MVGMRDALQIGLRCGSTHACYRLLARRAGFASCSLLDGGIRSRLSEKNMEEEPMTKLPALPLAARRCMGAGDIRGRRVALAHTMRELLYSAKVGVR